MIANLSDGDQKMSKDQDAYKQIALTLATHFDGLYYIDIESGSFNGYVAADELKEAGLPSRGKDFFKAATKVAHKCVHPDDLDAALEFLNKENMIKYLADHDSKVAIYRLVGNGGITHMRNVGLLSEDKKHIVFCAKNVESEYRAAEEQRKNLASAELLARLDGLTGIRNKHAFREYSEYIEKSIETKKAIVPFGIVMCDMNDLKRMNDTRGHSYGDEALQSASRMISETFKNSPVYRIGGDEFVVILTGSDFKNREKLLKQFREKSEANRIARSGPVVASGMAVYHPEKDSGFDDVFQRADQKMYKNKNKLKSMKLMEDFRKMDKIKKAIPDERKRLLDAFFGAMCTMSNGGYVYLNDMRYDFSRWSLALVNDFNLDSEYMYHADSIWQNYVHPDDVETYRNAVDAVLCNNDDVQQIWYRAKKADGTYVLLTTRGFVLVDSEGKPEYFGGIIIPEGNT